MPIRELPLPDAETFRNEIAVSGQPAILRGLIDAWPAVQAGRRSVGTLVDYLRRLDSGGHVDAIMTPPQAAGRIFYDDDMNGFNFVRNRLPHRRNRRTGGALWGVRASTCGCRAERADPRLSAGLRGREPPHGRR